jgi:hypothetical protein
MKLKNLTGREVAVIVVTSVKTPFLRILGAHRTTKVLVSGIGTGMQTNE